MRPDRSFKSGRAITQIRQATSISLRHSLWTTSLSHHLSPPPPPSHPSASVTPDPSSTLYTTRKTSTPATLPWITAPSTTPRTHLRPPHLPHLPSAHTPLHPFTSTIPTPHFLIIPTLNRPSPTTPSLSRHRPCLKTGTTFVLALRHPTSPPVRPRTTRSIPWSRIHFLRIRRSTVMSCIGLFAVFFVVVWCHQLAFVDLRRRGKYPILLGEQMKLSLCIS